MGCLHPSSCSYTALSLGLCGGWRGCLYRLEKFWTKTPDYTKAEWCWNVHLNSGSSAWIRVCVGMCVHGHVWGDLQRDPSRNLCSSFNQSFSTQIRVSELKPINCRKCFGINEILLIQNHWPSWKTISLLSMGQYLTAYTPVLTESS